MTKINKIICDICQKEIDVSLGMGMFERIEINREKNFLAKLPGKFNEKDIRKESLDMCNNCSELLAEYVKKLKTEVSIKKN